MYVGAATGGDEDLIAAVNLVVQDRLASIVSNSWFADVETTVNNDVLLDPIFIQGGLKGIGMYFGSGDWGDNQCGSSCPVRPVPGNGEPSVLYPASSPYVTGAFAAFVHGETR